DILDVNGSLLDVPEVQAFVRVDIENHALRQVGRVPVRAPDVEFQRVHLDATDQTGQVLDPEGAAILAGHRLEPAPLHGLRHAGQLVFLEEGFGQIVVGIPHQRQRTVLDMRQHLVRYRRVIGNQVSLGDLGVGIHDLVRVRELHAHGGGDLYA